MDDTRIIKEFDNARRAIRTVGADRGDTIGDIEPRVAEFNAALSEFERRAWERGVELGASMVQRNAEDIIAQAALAVLGKDRADGEVDLGALGKRYAV